VSSRKYLGIILHSDLSWTDHVNYTVKKAWKALYFTMRILKKGKSNMKSLAYMSLVGLILEYRAACRDPFSNGQINVLDRVRKEVAKFVNVSPRVPQPTRLGNTRCRSKDWHITSPSIF